MKTTLNNPRVLTVDDDFTSLILYQESLQPAGFIVDEADSGKSAIKQFTLQKPDIILLDVVMPSMNGYETCKKIRKLPGGADVPIIMVTGLDDLDSISHAYEAGATDFITKPLNWPILQHRLNYILRANNAIIKLRRNEQLLSHAQRLAHLGSWEWNPSSNNLSYSEEFSHIFCLEKESDKTTFRDIVRSIHPRDRRIVQQSFHSLTKKNPTIAIEHRINMPNKELRHVNLQIELIDGESEISFSGTAQDITESKKTEEQIRKLAYYDALTGLPNRRLFRTQLERALNTASRSTDIIALLFIDIDEFKQINDSLGHDAGDQLLTQFSERLRLSTRKSDYPSRNSDDKFKAEMSRLGGDEFTVMLTNLSSVHGAGHVAQRLVDSMQKPFSINGSNVYSSVSIGLSLFPNDGDNMEDLIKCADTAMYHAKAAGKNNYRLFDIEMNNSVEDRLSTENKIKNALDNNEFEVFYQPRVDLITKKISGLEALLRWPQADGTIIMPNDFIPIAEENKLIIPLGGWVIKEVIKQIKTWINMGITDIPVAINVSGHQLIHSELDVFIPNEISKHEIPAHLVELEITESVLIKEPDSVAKTLKTLHSLGIKIAIDDFGTGYSSMTMLKNFSLDILKIDRSFIANLPNKKDSAIIKAIISMAHGLEMDVIGEGVETQDQMNFYRDQNCTQVQGFLFSSAVPVTEVTQSLLAQQRNGQA